MENGTIFEAARDIVRKETVSFSIKQFQAYVKKTDHPTKKESPSKDRSTSRKK